MYQSCCARFGGWLAGAEKSIFRRPTSYFLLSNHRWPSDDGGPALRAGVSAAVDRPGHGTVASPGSNCNFCSVFLFFKFFTQTEYGDQRLFWLPPTLLADGSGPLV